jgi:hypothetical protein
LYPQSGLKGQHGFSWLLPTRKKAKKANIQEEQLKLLKKIIAELQILNANIASIKSGPPMAEADALLEGGSEDEELEDYE